MSERREINLKYFVRRGFCTGFTGKSRRVDNESLGSLPSTKLFPRIRSEKDTKSEKF